MALNAFIGHSVFVPHEDEPAVVLSESRAIGSLQKVVEPCKAKLLEQGFSHQITND